MKINDDILYFDVRALTALTRAARCMRDVKQALKAARRRVDLIAAGKQSPNAEPDPEAVKLIVQTFRLDPTGAGWWEWLKTQTEGGGDD